MILAKRFIVDKIILLFERVKMTKIRLLTTVLVVAMINFLELNANSEMLVLQTLTEKWVETENIRSKEREEGVFQLDNLTQMKKVLKEQISTWQKEVKRIENEQSRSDKERESWLKRKKKSLHERELAITMLAPLEKKLIGLEVKLPQKLQVDCSKPYRVIKEKMDERKWLSRFVACLTIVKKIKSFHRNYNLVTQDIVVNGKKIAARVLFYGISGAVFLGFDQMTAGYGKPTNQGWQWSIQSENKESISQSIEIISGTASQLKTVSLPVEVDK